MIMIDDNDSEEVIVVFRGLIGSSSNISYRSTRFSKRKVTCLARE